MTDPHDELFSMLFGTRRWNAKRVAEGLRSADLSDAERAVALRLLANLIDGTAPRRRLKLEGDGQRGGIMDMRDEYERFMEIGRWVEAEIAKAEAEGRENAYDHAIFGAEDEIGVKDSMAARALKFYRERKGGAAETGKWYPMQPFNKKRLSRKKKRD